MKNDRKINSENKKLSLDPRTGIVLLLISNVIVFTQKTLIPGNVFVLVFLILMIMYGCISSAWKSAAYFIAIVVIQKYVLPFGPGWIRFLGITLNYGRRMLPTIMAGLLLVKTNSLGRFILAMRKLHVPESIVIPIAVAVRYFPAIKEEFLHIREAMKLRDLSFSQKLEGYIVPLALTATTTAEELSQAAVTRGIENPVSKSSIEMIRITWRDIVITVSVLVIAAAVLFIEGN